MSDVADVRVDNKAARDSRRVSFLKDQRTLPAIQSFLINSATCKIMASHPALDTFTEHLQLGQVPGTEADGIWVATYRLVPAFRC